MSEIDFAEYSDKRLIESLHKFSSTCDDHIEAEQEWEKRKRQRENAMLSMTEALIISTDKMLRFSKYSFWVAIGSFVLAFAAIILTLLYNWYN